MKYDNFTQYMFTKYPEILTVPGVDETDADSPYYVLGTFIQSDQIKGVESKVISDLAYMYNNTTDVMLENLIYVEVFENAVGNCLLKKIIKDNSSGKFLTDFIEYENEWKK